MSSFLGLGLGSDPLASLCRADLTAADFFSNDLGRFTPCFIDLAILGLAHSIAIIAFSVQLARTNRPSCSRYRLAPGAGTTLQVLQLVAAALCALVPVFELNGKLGQAAGDPDAPAPAPHEWAAAALATCSWVLLLVLLWTELQGRYVPVGRWVVRFAVTLVCASELVKLRIIVAAEPVPEYFFYLYITYVVMQCFLTLMALAWWPSDSQLVMEHEGYIALAGEDALAREQQQGAHPETRAGLLGALSFSWLSPLLASGYKASLTRQQIPGLPPADRLDRVSRDFDRHWKDEMKRPESASLGNACWKTVRHLYVAALPFKLTVDAAQFIGPIFLNRLLMVVADKSAPAWEGYLYAGIMFAGTLVGSVADHQHFHLVMRAGSRLNAVLGAQVHSQILRLTPGARAQFSSGRIFSLISSDAEQLSQLCASALGVMSSPLRIGGAMYLLYLHLGVSSLATFMCLVLMIPINIVMVRWSGALLKATLLHSDERTKLEGELVGGVEVVKCSAWEGPFLERINLARSKELATMWRLAKTSACQSFVIFSIPTVVPVVTFSAYLLLGNELSSAKAFTALALFNVLRFPVFMLPQLLQLVTQARVSLTRIQEILAADTLEQQEPLPPAKPGEAAVSLRGDFSWDAQGKGLPSLADVELQVPAGQLVLVVGTTGSGKSTLLSAMLRQMQQVYGDAPLIRGRVAYVPQAAFIINATVRDNILFGQPFEPVRYEECVQAACLDTDLRMLAGGDATELGDKGVNLSGGQRQRVSIARALYSDADVVILDDPLSALDSKVGRKVFERAIKGRLQSRGRTVILATNQLYFVQAANLVLCMGGGKVAEQGSFTQLMATGGMFAAMMKEVQVDEAEQDDAGGAAAAEDATAPLAIQGNSAAVGAQLGSEEKMAQGAISASVLFRYMAVLGGVLSFLYLVTSFVLVEALRVCTNVWLSFWTGNTDGQQEGAGYGPLFYLAVFAGISAVQLLVQLVNMVETPRLCLRAAGSLHQQLLHCLLQAPMSFFHTTPLGRIVNRLTKDTADVDRQLAMNSGMAFRNFLQVVSCIALVGWVAPLALPSMVAIMLAFYLLYNYYQASLRQVKRLEAVSRSPVFASVTEAISGCTTIQAFGTGARLVQRHAQLIDTSMANTFISNSLGRWLGVRLEALGNLCTLAAGLVAVEQRGGANNAGLVLSYAMQMTILMSLLLRSTSVVENNFNSVERVIEYTELPREGGPLEVKKDKKKGLNGAVQAGPPPSWPSEGVVEFKQVAMRYRPGLPLVLRSVTFRAAANEKVGIVGRTGAGKSSMIGCLFRLTEVEGGAIEIDGVNIAQLPLHRLRSSMALIPQVPVLFTGTIRLNLSPFGLHGDAELWSALRRAHLAAVVEAWPAGLDTLLQEGGAPLSAGQKQLLALARAQLNPAKVLVLDEATANVDVETDALIQKTMRTEFKYRTILAIAHRLHTIIDYDKVLVLDKGLVAEFGSPGELLALPGGIFTSMVDDTGDATAKFLKAVAAGKVDLEASIAEAAEGGMEKLCTPLACPEAGLLQAGAGMPAGLLLHSLAAQLLERSRAVIKKVKGISLDLVKDAREDEEALATEGLLQQFTAGGGGSGGGAGASLTSAQRSLLQALELLAQVEQYARAAETVVRGQRPEGGGDAPANLGDVRRSRSSGVPAPEVRPPRCAAARSAAEEEMRLVLSDLVARNISCPSKGREPAAAAPGGASAAAWSSELVSSSARLAARMVRAASIRDSKDGV